MDEQLKSNLTSRHHWLRLLFMVLFALLLQVASLVMWALVAVQFLWSLITGADNEKLRRFGHSLATFIYEALQFLTYNTERKPFPFAEWPELPAKREDIEGVGVVDPGTEPGAGTPTAGEDIVEETREVVEDVEHAEAETPPEAVAESKTGLGEAATKSAGSKTKPPETKSPETSPSKTTGIAQDAGASNAAKPDDSPDAPIAGDEPDDKPNDKL